MTLENCFVGQRAHVYEGRAQIPSEELTPKSLLLQSAKNPWFSYLQKAYLIFFRR